MLITNCITKVVGKRHSIIFPLIFLLLSLTACSEGGDSGDDTSNEPTQVQMPDVIGLDEAAANSNLTDLAFSVTIERENSNTPIGEVVAQDPVADTLLDEGSDVSITVSLGINVPDLSGMTQTEAIQALTDANLNYSVSEENSVVPIGQVIHQSIDAATNVDPDTVVEIIVSLGIAVPDVVGINMTDAVDLLIAQGFSVEVNFSLSTAAVEQVVSQDPIAGTNLNNGSTVRVNVSEGGVIIPNLVGMTENDATQALAALGLNSNVTYENSQTLIGNIISQSVESSTVVALNATIDIVVSLGVQVPNVVGENISDAIVALTNLGFNVDTNLALNTAPPEQVFAQDPPEGTNLNVGSTIVISVSTGGIAVPVLTGLSLSDATLLLQNLDLTYQISRVPNTYPIDTVFYQSINPGTLVETGTQVELSVSDGLIVPNVIGMNLDAATSILESEGFTVSINPVYDNSQTAGEVFGQDPMAGTQSDGTVLVTISVYTSDKVLGDTACLTEFVDIVSQISLANPAEGGLLYDKWWVTAGIPVPVNDNPLWVTQSTNTRSGADTWRCKECHGWDYEGNDGVYGDTSNSHYTGFPGILQAAGDEPINIFCKIHSGTNIDARHNFSQQISSINILHLTRFIVESQSGATPRGIIDTAPHIATTGTIIGANPSAGDTLYTSAGCAASSCHGINGDMQFQPLAELALANPWETLHKIRFGHPGSVPQMPSYSDPGNPVSQRLTLLDSKNVLAHVQTLAPVDASACTSDFAGLVSQIDLADAQQGGQLYDKWWMASGAQAPTTDHPLWSLQSTNTRTGEDTWRCQECHGWDYAGVDGVYGDITNSHYTGFPGLLASTAGDQPIDVFCAIRSGIGINPAHNFTTVMSDTQILHLTKFITETRTGTMPLGIIDTSSLFQADGTSNGSSANGASLYASMGCASSNCHGLNGDVQARPLGVVSVDSAWETIHKIRFGHPGSVPVMPAYSEANTLAQANDVVAYTQTLGDGSSGGGGTTPSLSDASIIALGGRLYDNWIAETGSAVPPIDNPLWAYQGSNTRTGSATWRCKECHGWDYKGASGVYGDPDSSHYTGFGGILNTEKTEQEIMSYLTTGFFILGEIVHVFDMLSTAEKEALAKFIKQGMVDSSPFFGNTILADGTVIINGSQANFENGGYLYSFQGIGVLTGACELCHDANGLGEPGIDLGYIARTNPWEFLHKIRFGQPATAMPSMYDALDPVSGSLVFDIQDSVDIIQYSQSLNLP